MTKRIDDAQVRHIAFLTRLALDDAEVAGVQRAVEYDHRLFRPVR